MPLGDYLHGRMQRESGKRLGEEYHKAVFLGTIFLINDLFLQIKTLQLSLYAEDGQLHNSNADPVSMKGRVSNEVKNSANVWFEFNRMISNLRKNEEMIFRNIDRQFN